MKPDHTLVYEFKESEDNWITKKIRVPGYAVTTFEALSMAAGLRAEKHQIRNVKVLQEKTETREIY